MDTKRRNRGGEVKWLKKKAREHTERGLLKRLI